MRRVNLRDPPLQYDDDDRHPDPDGPRSGMFRFGPQLGAQQTGATLYELVPGDTLCPKSRYVC